MAQIKNNKPARMLEHFGIIHNKYVLLGALVLLTICGLCIGVRYYGSSFEVIGTSTAQEDSVETSDDATDAPASQDVLTVQDSGADDSEDPEEEAALQTYASTIFVHVDGAVVNPGLYELPEGSRVNDAVIAAGGLREDADTTNLNLATVLLDAVKVYVPVAGEDVSITVSSSADGLQSGSSESSSASQTLININTATVDELCTLSGIGEVTAQKIIDDREQNGAFTSIEDIKRVSGIGDKKFEAIKDMICV